jgi:hypothetical protein
VDNLSKILVDKAPTGRARRAARAEWVRKMNANEKGLADLMELYCKGLIGMIVKEGKLIPPP